MQQQGRGAEAEEGEGRSAWDRYILAYTCLDVGVWYIRALGRGGGRVGQGLMRTLVI